MYFVKGLYKDEHLPVNKKSLLHSKQIELRIMLFMNTI